MQIGDAVLWDVGVAGLLAVGAAAAVCYYLPWPLLELFVAASSSVLSRAGALAFVLATMCAYGGHERVCV